MGKGILKCAVVHVFPAELFKGCQRDWIS